MRRDKTDQGSLESQASTAYCPHPGGLFRSCIEPWGISVEEAAEGLGVEHTVLQAIINGTTSITGEMAVRLSQGFGGTPEGWLRLQMQHNLWQVEQRKDEVEVSYIQANHSQKDDWEP